MYAFALLGALVFLGGWEWPFGTDVGWGYQLLLTMVKMSLFILFYPAGSARRSRACASTS